jgi:3-dehydroquinate dehydratase-1
LATKICVSIAPDNVTSIKEQAHRAFILGADYVEIRFDFLEADFLAEALRASKDIKDRAIFTLRSSSEGGKFAGSEQDRLQWLATFAELQPMLLDIELDTLKKNDELADFLEEQKSRILVSWHDFEKTPPNDEIADMLSEMRTYSNYVKVVTTAKSIEDALRLLEMYNETTVELHPIFFAMGEAGVISRVLCTLVGNAPFTYASLERVLAPGQLTLIQIKKLYDKITYGKA